MVKTHLLSEEVIDATKTQDLGELASIPKGIWEPGFPTTSSKCILKVLLTVQVLTGERLPGRYHTIMFEPGSADWGESTLGHILGNPLEGFRVKLLQPDVMLCRGSSKSVIRKSIHEVALRTPASSDLLMRLSVPPKPGCINMAMLISEHSV